MWFTLTSTLSEVTVGHHSGRVAFRNTSAYPDNSPSIMAQGPGARCHAAT